MGKCRLQDACDVHLEGTMVVGDEFVPIYGGGLTSE